MVSVFSVIISLILTKRYIILDLKKIVCARQDPTLNTNPGSSPGSASPLDVFVRAASSSALLKGLWLPIEPQLN